jgi:hypothetical protein
LCFPSSPSFPNLVPITFSHLSQSCSCCFLPVSSLSHSVSFSLCVVVGSIDLGWSFLLGPSRFISLDKKVGWFIIFLFFASYVPVFFVVSIALAFWLGCRLELPLLLLELMICLLVVPIAFFWWVRLDLCRVVVF